MSNSLDPKIIKKVSEQVYRRFPEIAGAKPSIKNQPAGKNKKYTAKNEDGFTNYLLTYRGSVNVGEGKKMGRWVRVVVDNRGAILKMTTSR